MMSNDEKKYAYFFTRQDIFPEYQLVQTAHAALKLGALGAHHAVEARKPLLDYQHYDFSPDETYFTCVGVRDMDALMAVVDILEVFNLRYEVFHEPDLNGGEETAIGVYPVDESRRGFLLAFNLLKFGGKG